MRIQKHIEPRVALVCWTTIMVLVYLGVEAFSPVNTGSDARCGSGAVRSNLFFRPCSQTPTTKTSKNTQLQMAIISNPLKALPWNVKREKEREARRLKLEGAKLHRELGVAEDATFEEITEATERLILKAEGDVKKKIRIEVTKDRIMQIRLNERLAGLTSATDEARIAEETDLEDEMFISKKKKKGLSSGEDDDDDDDDDSQPGFFQGLIQKPDVKWRNQNIKIWGIASLIGFMIPPLASMFGFINFIMMSSLLGMRDVPDMDRFEGMQTRGDRPSAGTAMLVSFSVWLLARIVVGAALAGKIEGSQYGVAIETLLCNIILGTATAYIKLKPKTRT